MEKKFTPTIGVFAGILNRQGWLLVRKRSLPEEKESLISGKTVESKWELPGGEVEMTEMLAAGNEQGLINALKREIEEETGLEITLSLPTPMFPVVIAKEISPERIARDIALLIIVQLDQWKGEPEGEIGWVYSQAVNTLAKGSPEGQLVSGFGKRMHRMALIALSHSPNGNCRLKAQNTLKKIYSSWK